MVARKQDLKPLMRNWAGWSTATECAGGMVRGVERPVAAFEEASVVQEDLLAARIEANAQRARYQDLFDFVPDGYLVTGPRGRIEEANRSAGEMLHVQPQFLLGKPLILYIHRDDRPRLVRAMAQMRRVEHGEWTLRLVPRNAPTRIAQITARAVRCWGGSLEALRWILRDVTESRRAGQALRASRMRLRSMASKLALAEEQERRRIASEIHDHISQSLAVAKLRLGLLRESLAGAQLATVDEVRQLLSQVLAQSRSLTFELSPAILYELGLGAALEWLIEQRSSCGTEFKFHNDAGNVRPRRDVAVTLFQAVRELLTNIVKHARATAASVRMSRADGEIVIEVRDNGIGFNPPSRLARRAGYAGLGLFGVQERMDHLGGHTEINCAPGQGTSVRLVAPLRAAGKTPPTRKGSHAAQCSHRGRPSHPPPGTAIIAGKGAGPAGHGAGRQRPRSGRGGRKDADRPGDHGRGDARAQRNRSDPQTPGDQPGPEGDRAVDAHGPPLRGRDA